MVSPAQAIALLNKRIENVVLEQANRKIALTADRISTRLQSRIKLDLQRFFPQLAALLNGLEFEPVDQYEYSNEEWKPLDTEYVRTKKAGRIDYFVYSELPKVLKRAQRSKRKNLASARQGRVSLRQTLARISNPERIFGPITVTVESNTSINKAGKRYYRAGTVLDGVKAGGRLVQNGRDVVSIRVSWAPKFEGFDVRRRGVVEAHMPRAGRLREKLMHKEGSYRALVGPRMLWYQDVRIQQIIDQIIQGKGLK